MAKPLPKALRALRASLRTTQAGLLRDRIQAAVAYLEGLYSVPTSPADEDTGDLRRRQFAAGRHPMIRRAPAPRGNPQ